MAAPEEWIPATASELSRMLRENGNTARSPLTPVGGRTGLRQGWPVDAQARPVVTSELTRIIDYPHDDMTITVEAGIRVAELQRILAEHQQRLPLDIPQSHRATLGGAAAANANGPSRFGAGGFRDYVLGISAVDGVGRLFSAGGRVVKNVAGYDLCKLLIGSHGVLAVITQLTLKVRPVAPLRAMILAPLSSGSQAEAVLTGLNTSATRPAAIELLNKKAVWQVHQESRLPLPTDSWLLCIGYEGGEREVRWQMEQAASELHAWGVHESQSWIDEGATLWETLTEYQAASDDPLTFEAVVRPANVVSFLERAEELGAAVQAHAGDGVIIGHLSDSCHDSGAAAQQLAALRSFLPAGAGEITVLQCDDAWRSEPQLHPAPPAEWALMQRIKQTFDPLGVLNPGRLGERVFS